MQLMPRCDRPPAAFPDAAELLLSASGRSLNRNTARASREYRVVVRACARSRASRSDVRVTHPVTCFTVSELGNAEAPKSMESHTDR